MVEKIGPIKNPLTIIAIFAAIAEISGTVVLPFISESNQGTYIWFLMLFPLLLVVLFFLTLNFNHKVLYAPSDFKDEENFFKSFKPASPTERDEKLREQAREVAEEVADPAPLANQPEPAVPSQPFVTASPATRFSAQARYSLAEDLVLNKIARETGQPIRRDVSFGASVTGRRFIFDGVIMDNKQVTAIEVKYISSPISLQKRIKEAVLRVISISESLPDSTRSRFNLVLALVTDLPEEQHSEMASRVHAMIGVTPFPVQVRVFGLSQLEKEVAN
jgi:hypothetical protein